MTTRNARSAGARSSRRGWSLPGQSADGGSAPTLLAGKSSKRSKYGNSRNEAGDSKAERARMRQLLQLAYAGEINMLQWQVKFVLIPTQRDASGKLLERECAYIADFMYQDRAGRTVVEDVKGFRTPEYIIKRKLMLKVHGVRVVEVAVSKRAVIG